MDGGKAPAPPNPGLVAGAGAAANKGTAVTQQNLNAVSQVTPMGSLTYSQDGTWSDGTPKYTATTSLSPTEQGIYDKGATLRGNQIGAVTDAYKNPFDLNSATSNQQADIARKLLDPTWNTRQDQLQTQLANQGISQGSEAYTNAMRDFGMQRDNSYNSMLLQGRGQAVNEALTQRNQPLQEAGGLIGLAQGAYTNPNLINTPQAQVAPVDVAGIYNSNYQGQVAQYQADQSKQAAMLGGLAGLGGTALGGWAYGGFKKPF